MIIQFEQDLKDAIRTIPDYPKPGLMFREITTLLGTARAFRRRAVDELVQPRAMHEDAANKGDWVILVDDLIATVRTAEGAVKPLRQLGAGARRLLHHRPARPRRRRQAAQARRAGTHPREF